MPDPAQETSSRGPSPRAAPQAEPAEASANGERAQRAVIPIELQLLEASLDVRATLRAVVSAVVPSFADWCFVDLMDATGVPQSAELAYGDPGKAELAAELRTIAPALGWASKAAQAGRDPAPRLVGELADLVQWATHDDRRVAALRRISPNSIITAPLVARDRTIGTMTLVRSWTPRFKEGDLAFVERLVAPAALALDNARSLSAEKTARQAREREIDIERHERAEAEKAVLQLRRLESVTSSLAAVLSPATVAKVAFENGLSLLDCSSATVTRALGDGRLEVLFALGWPQDLRRRLAPQGASSGSGSAASHVLDLMEPDAPALVAEAYRIQTAIWIESPQALATAYPNLAEGLRSAGSQSWAAVPLRVDARTIGAIELGMRRARRLDDGERAFVLAVANLVAQALERARLREVESRLTRG